MGLFCVLLLIGSCIDRLEVADMEKETGTLVVDGQITNEPGPYQVKLFRASANNAVLNSISLLLAKKVTIFDDTGESEDLVRNEEGVYETSATGIRGQVGRKYAIRIDMLDGSSYESIPDELQPVESIDSLYYEWQSVKPLSGPTENGFKIYLDTNSPNSQSFLRWRFSGTYVIETFPQLRRMNDANCSNTPPPPEPPACSGWVYVLAIPGNRFAGGDLQYVGECTCCICYTTDSETKPNLNESIVVTDGTYKKVGIGYVPFNQWTFGKGKYMVKVEQMSLTKDAYEFWKIFKDQKEGASSLFQPALGKVKTNLFSTNTDKPVLGIFYASAVRKKVMFLTEEDAQAPVTPPSIEPIANCVLWNSCERLFSFPNSSRNPPPEWQ